MTSGNVAVVTGAGTGIGKAVASALVVAGWRVAFAGRRIEPLEAAIAATGAADRAIAVSTDVSRSDSVDALFARTKAAFGRVDLLFNNAGVSIGGPFEDLTHRPVAGGRGHQPHRRVPVRASGVPDDEGAVAARRPHHQQRLDLGPRATPQLRALHRHQARDHRPHQVDLARWAQARHRLRPDRHRQRRHRDGSEDGQGRAAGQRHDRRRAADGRRARGVARSSTWRACRSTRTSSS